MMISAFGIQHEISKGLPRHLQDIAPVIGASPAKQFRGGEPLSRGDHAYLRVRAHQSGKLAARKNAEWKKLPKTLESGNIARAEEARKPVVEAATRGKLARSGSRKAIVDNTPIVRPKRISKSLKPNHVQAMARTLTSASGKGTNGDRARAFSRARLANNKKGAQAAVARPGNRDPKGNPEYSKTMNGFKIANARPAWKPEPTRYPSRPR